MKLVLTGLFATAAAFGVQTSPHESGRACFDGVDNDKDGVSDCQDPDCKELAQKYSQYCNTTVGATSRCKNTATGPVDQYGSTCNMYGSKKWCTATGRPGTGWQRSWGSSIAPAAQSGCCACGGGRKASSVSTPGGVHDSTAGAAPLDELTLFKLPEGMSGGQCCDGSPAAWYYGSPANESVSDWVIWMMGGGGCTTPQKCKQRMVGKPTIMGSGRLKPTFFTGSKNTGKKAIPSKWILSDDPAMNPDFFHAHKVYIHYCSSDEFAGTRTKASAETFGFYFSGHLHLVNIFGELKKKHPKAFGSASRVLFAGSSAGGLGTFFNVDWARDQFPSSTVVRGAPLGGWFVPGDFPDQPHQYNPPSLWPDWASGKVTPWPIMPLNGSLDLYRRYVNPACAKALGPNAYTCQSVHVLYPYIQTPMYVMENNFDTNQLQSAFDFPASNHSERAQDYVRYFGRGMRNSTAQVRQKPEDGLFLSSCYDHTEGLGVGPDFGTRVNSKGSGALLGEWFNGRLPASDRILVDDCGELPCNPTCTNWPGAAPGPAPGSGCVAQLVKDGCDPEGGVQKCAGCARQHQADLRSAGCSEAFVKGYCEGKAPPPPPPAGGCKAALDSLCPVAAGPGPEKCARCAEAHVLKLVAAGCDPQDIKQLCLARKKSAAAL